MHVSKTRIHKCVCTMPNVLSSGSVFGLFEVFAARSPHSSSAQKTGSRAARELKNYHMEGEEDVC